MTDPQQTTPIPTDNQQTPPTPNQETDFFGGGDTAFSDAVISQTDQGTPVVGSTPFVPDEKAREPTIPEEKMEDEEIKIEKIEPEIEPETDPVPEIEVPVETAPIIEPVEEPISEPEAEPVPVPVTVAEKAPVETVVTTSDLGKKFTELSQLCRQISEWKKSEEGFQLVGADNDKLRIMYKFVFGDPDFPMVSVTKVETDKVSAQETIHELNFYLNEAGTSLNVNLDEELLFEEEVDLKDDVKKRMQVMEKLNKFIFLATEESKKIEKEMKEKEAEQQEKMKLQDIFRNF